MDPLHRCSRSRLRRRRLGTRSGSRGSSNSRRRCGRAAGATAASTLRNRNACRECEEAGEHECGEKAMHNQENVNRSRSFPAIHAWRLMASFSGMSTETSIYSQDGSHPAYGRLSGGYHLVRATRAAAMSLLTKSSDSTSASSIAAACSHCGQFGVSPN